MGKWLAVALLCLASGVGFAEGSSSSLSGGMTGGRPEITGISHVTFYADDMAKSKHFYTSVLGWDAVPDPGAKGGSQAGERFYANHLQYVELVTPPRAAMDDRLDLVAFATTDAEGLRRELAAKGVVVPTAVTVGADGSRSFLVHDPEGNTVGFTQAGPHGPAAPANAGARLSTHIIHAGYVVRDRAALDHFYKDELGFHLYWQGGAKTGNVDWVMMQVPDGTDWIEYMLNLGDHPSRSSMGSANHIAPGVASVPALQARLEKRGWQATPGVNPQVMGVDGKWQLDLHDPDGTRVEFMEFLPAGKVCCSAYTGRQPGPEVGW